VWSETGQEYSEARIIFIDYEESNWTYDPVADKYFWHRFYFNQPDLNYDNPAVHEEMLQVIRFWLDMGVDGFRADAVPYLYEREGTNSENLPETHSFLKKVRRLLNDEYPGRICIAEANQWPEDLLPYFGGGDEFHMCFHFPLMPRLYMALKRGNKQPILDVLAQTPAKPPGTQWLIFLRNHDELTLEMVTEEERQWMWEQYAPDPQMRLNQGIRRRLTPLVDNNRRKWLLLNALPLSLPGAPIIYYGDEIGMGDNIILPDRHGCRTPMQWSDGKNGGFSQASKSYLPVNDDPVFGYKQVNVKSQEVDQSSFLWAMRFLLEARSNTPALRKGTLEHLNVNNPALLAYWRVHEKSRLLCLYNLSDEQQAISLDLTSFQGFTVQDLLVPGDAEAVTAFPMVKLLAPHASHWLRFEKAPD
jgi:maltose alpha-D-glucosyltransferase/alpha-amylase